MLDFEIFNLNVKYICCIPKYIKFYLIQMHISHYEYFTDKANRLIEGYIQWPYNKKLGFFFVFESTQNTFWCNKLFLTE